MKNKRSTNDFFITCSTNLGQSPMKTKLFYPPHTCLSTNTMHVKELPLNKNGIVLSAAVHRSQQKHMEL